MHLQFGKNPLGVMAGCVGADLELLGYGLVRSALSQQYGHLNLPASEPVSLYQAILADPVVPGGRGAGWLLPPQVAPELTQLVYGAPQPIHQRSIVVAQVCKRGKKIHQAIGREGRQKRAICTRPGSFIVHGKPSSCDLSSRLPLHPAGPV
jgi:hypothetical protein